MYFLFYCIPSVIAHNATRLTLSNINVTLFEPKLPSSRYDYLAPKFTQTASNGKVVVPWTVTANFPADKLAVIREAMTMLENDVECMEYPKVSRSDLSSTTWYNGILKKTQIMRFLFGK